MFVLLTCCLMGNSKLKTSVKISVIPGGERLAAAAPPPESETSEPGDVTSAADQDAAQTGSLRTGEAARSHDQSASVFKLLLLFTLTLT